MLRKQLLKLGVKGLNLNSTIDLIVSALCVGILITIVPRSDTEKESLEGLATTDNILVQVTTFFQQA